MRDGRDKVERIRNPEGMVGTKELGVDNYARTLTLAFDILHEAF